MRACPSLTAISLYWNLNVGVETLKALSEACPRLSQVNLSGCKAVTDLGIVQLAQGCPQLTHVDLTRWGSHFPHSGMPLQSAVGVKFE